MKPLVYIAGPITGDPWGCVRAAMPMFGWLLDNGAVPVAPQLSIVAEMVEHRPYEQWVAHGLDTLAHCAAIVRIPGHSPGADAETARAAELGIPVFDAADIDFIYRWLHTDDLFGGAA